MTGPAFDRVLDALRSAGRPVAMDGPNRARSSCPAHDGDNKTALSIVDTADRVNLHCFTRECDGADVLGALGLSIRDRYHEPRGDALAKYTYPAGFTITRKMGADAKGKDFRPSPGWSGRPRPLYRGDRIASAVAAGRPVYLVEGEEDVHAMEAADRDAVAVSAPHGARSFHLADVEPLRGASVVAVVDRDARGDDWAAGVRVKLAGVAAGVRFVRAAVGKDASDHLAAGLTVADFAPYAPQGAAGAPQDPEDTEDDHEPAPDAPGPQDAPEDLYGRLVAEKVRALRVDRDARAIIAREGHTVVPFDAGTLADVLARPAEPAARVESLIPWQASTLVVAQRKTGKTTLVLNLARCLLTGEPFLGSLAVRPVTPGARVALLNYEVSGAQLARWAEDAGVPRDRLFLVNLRGRRNPLAHPDDRAALAELLRGQRVEVLVVDPFGRAYCGESQNDAGQVQSWLVALDQFARAEVGALDVILTAHAGWNGERTRGSSALEDWADSIVTLTRDEESGDRFLRATGRDVDLDEDRLSFDPAARTLSLSGDGSRKMAGATRQDAESVAAILAILEKHHPEGVSGNDLAKGARRKDAAFTNVRDALVRNGTLTADRRPGRGGGVVYRLTPPNIPNIPEHTESVPSEPTEPPFSSGGSGSGMFQPNIPSASGVRLCSCGEPCETNRVRCPEHMREMLGVR